MNLIKKTIQRIKCKIPFSLYHFHHAPLVVERQLSARCQLLRCESCGQRFVINYSARVILPWDRVSYFYDEHEPGWRLAERLGR